MGRSFADPLDVGDEPHVEHPVGFVDHQDFHADHQQPAALVMIEQAARRGDQDVGAPVQLAVLVLEGHAADQQGNGELVVDAELLEACCDLRGEFARRFQNERTRHSRPRPARLQLGQHRQHEGGGLAGPVCAMPMMSRPRLAAGIACA